MTVYKPQIQTICEWRFITYAFHRNLFNISKQDLYQPRWTSPFYLNHCSGLVFKSTASASKSKWFSPLRMNFIALKLRLNFFTGGGLSPVSIFYKKRYEHNCLLLLEILVQSFCRCDFQQLEDNRLDKGTSMKNELYMYISCVYV